MPRLRRRPGTAALTMLATAAAHAGRRARRFTHRRRVQEMIRHAEQDPALLWWPTLCEAAGLIRGLQDHALYARLLAAYDPSLPPQPARDSTFIGSGGGTGTLPTYRHVRRDGQSCFEKIYQTGSQAHRRCLWFHGTVGPQLAGRLRFPKLVRVQDGRRITVCHFEYCTGAGAQPGDVPDDFMRDCLPIVRLLLELEPRTLGQGDAPTPTDPRLRDFRTEPSYLTEREAALSIAPDTETACRLLELEALAAISPMVPGHGDLAPGNVFRGGVVADWDTAGLYPIGYDAAIVAVTARRYDRGFDSHSSFYTEALGEIRETGLWPAFMRNFAFFCHIHTSRLLDYPPSRNDRGHIAAFRTDALREAERWM